MSRTGKQLIRIPEGVDVTLDGNMVHVAGPRGSLKRLMHPEIRAEINERVIRLHPALQTSRTPALWGLERALLANMVHGVSQGYEKRLEVEGVGYRVQAQGEKALTLSLGFSHPINIAAPEGIAFKTEKNTIIISGIDKELVGQIAALIRAKCPPEPYKGKGIRYSGEVIRRKAGKKATATAK